jgi:hypothetical protein
MRSISRTLETAAQKKVISTDLLPDQKHFETFLQYKNDLHVITYLVLYHRLNAIKKRELDQKSPSTQSISLTERSEQTQQNEYELKSVQYALDIAPKMLALEILLIESKVSATKDDIRKKLIQLFNNPEDPEQKNIQQNIQQYYTEIRTDKTNQSLLNSSKLTTALAQTGAVGRTWWSTYGYPEEAFYKQLAATFYKLTRIDAYENEVTLSVNAQVKKIEALNNEINDITVSDPITQLDRLFEAHKKSLSSSTDKYEIKKAVDAKIQSLKDLANQQIADYKNTIAALKIKMNDFPENFRDQIESKLKKSTSRKKEKSILKESLLSYKEKLLKQYDELTANLNKELKKQADSKRQLIQSASKSTDTSDLITTLPDNKQVEELIAKLEKNSNVSVETLVNTCQMPLAYKGKINVLYSETSNFNSSLQIEREKQLKDLLHQLTKSYAEFILATKNLYIVEKNIGLLDKSFCDQLQHTHDIIIPSQESFLAHSVEEHSTDIIKTFEEAFVVLRKSLNEKSLATRNLLKDTLEADAKTSKTEDQAWDNALKKLPELLKKRAQDYIAQIKKLTLEAKTNLTGKYKVELALVSDSILKDYDLSIKQITTTFQSEELKSQLRNKDEERFIDEINDELTKKETSKELNRHQRDAKEKTLALDNAKKQEVSATTANSAQTGLIAERNRILAEKEKTIAEQKAATTQLKLKALEDKTLNSNSNNSLSSKQIAAGFFAGFGSMAVAPIAWIYGAINIGKQIREKTRSTFYGVLAGIATFLFMPIGWITGGIRIAQLAAQKIKKAPEIEVAPLLSSSLTPKTPTTRFSSIKLPNLSLQEQIKSVCSRNMLGYSLISNVLYIPFKPNRLYIDAKNGLFLESHDNKNVKFEAAATHLMLKILGAINNINDITLSVVNGLVLIEVKAYLHTNKFYLSAGNGDDKNLIYINSGKNSEHRVALQPEQFDTPEAVRKMLYPPSSPIPINTKPSDKGDHSPSNSQPTTRGFNFSH